MVGLSIKMKFTPFLLREWLKRLSICVSKYIRRGLTCEAGFLSSPEFMIKLVF